MEGSETYRLKLKIGLLFTPKQVSLRMLDFLQAVILKKDNSGTGLDRAC
jgi:hypothetical protein